MKNRQRNTVFLYRFIEKRQELSFAGYLNHKTLLCGLVFLVGVSCFSSRTHLLLFAELLVEALATRSHDSILAAHSPVESALKLSTEGELAHGVCLLIGEDDALRRKSLVLHTIEAGSDIADLGVGRVGGSDGGSQWRSHAVSAEANRVAVRRGHDGPGRVQRSRHGDNAMESWGRIDTDMGTIEGFMKLATTRIPRQAKKRKGEAKPQKKREREDSGFWESG
jgi:hypothetical protein